MKFSLSDIEAQSVILKILRIAKVSFNENKDLSVLRKSIVYLIEDLFINKKIINKEYSLDIKSDNSNILLYFGFSLYGKLEYYHRIFCLNCNIENSGYHTDKLRYNPLNVLFTELCL